MFVTPRSKDNYPSGIRFSIEDLHFIINAIGAELDTLEAGGELDKDAINPLSAIYHLESITNGEMYWELYQFLIEMTNGNKPSANITHRVMLHQLLLTEIEKFLIMLKDSNEDLKHYKLDILVLYNRLKKFEGQGLWVSAQNELITQEQLNEYQVESDWISVLDYILSELCPTEKPYEELDNFSQFEWQPHYPNTQEYRKALFWFRSQYKLTRANN